jgi:hypothetical protein
MIRMLTIIKRTLAQVRMGGRGGRTAGLTLPRRAWGHGGTVLNIAWQVI